MIILFCAGIMTGFLLAWIFICPRIVRCNLYKNAYYEYYDKWFKLHKRACEAWHISKDCYENDNMSDVANKAALTNIFFILNAYYGDDE